jgi:hypothetical protein
MRLAIGAVIVLVFSILVLSISTAQASHIGEDSKTAYTVGKFLYSDPPKPDQIFKIQYGAPANISTAEQLAECSQLGIDEEDCTEIAILQRHQQQANERKTIEDTKIQVNNAVYMIGIGAAIAGVFAIITLLKRP